MNDIIFQSGQFMTFVTLLLAGLAYILFTGIFSAFGSHGEHTTDGHSAEHTNDTISIFSPKIIAIFMVGFGAGGSLATYAHLGVIVSSLSGLGSGCLIGAIAFAGLSMLYSQQASSDVGIQDALNHPATVSTAIPVDGLGEVEVTVKGQLMSYRARAVKAFAKGASVTVSAINGTEVTVN